ncbi:MAG: type II CAAX endopeptidase family protein [Deferrisomatales bacterium]|nr:type II CAAX endopeptidase family protein [Deferrisomatales bacterium]
MAISIARDRAVVGPGEAVVILAVLVGFELLVATALPSPTGRTAGLWTVGGVRALELLLLCLYGWRRGWRPRQFGLLGNPARRGLRVGLLVCAGMGVAVLATEACVRLAGRGSFLPLVSGPRPGAGEWLPLLAVGGLIAPLFEELVFRGVLYAGLRRRLPAAAATLAVTALFAAAHLPTSGVPWVQAVGGVLFCVTYELSGSLWAPALVHATGNLALFLLPLWF